MPSFRYAVAIIVLLALAAGPSSAAGAASEAVDYAVLRQDHHHPPSVPLPTSPGEIEAYIAALRASPETHVHDAGSPKAGEHEAVMNLVPRSEATHIAIKSGSWFDPSTWYQGRIPGDDARVLIPEGAHVSYDGMGDARLFTVRVDGHLHFATDESSRMLVDTMVVSPSGMLMIGTEADPVQEGVNVDIVILNNGPINTGWDPMLLSRGIISHGDVSIHGAVTDSHEKVVVDPMAGHTSVKFAVVPEGWAVGDTIVIAGTHYDGYKWDNTLRTTRLYPSEDEVRVITKIDGGTVYFDNPLVHDHDAPREDLKTSVANYTRNVTISTENPASAEVYERGHVMFMHSDDVDVRYAAFIELGRTDKSIPSLDISDITAVRYDSNVQGRYALHLHRTGVSDTGDPAVLVGNAVFGSPGWGYVHHDSNAHLENNASFDTFGAGYVAETGNETGAWVDNIAINATGTSWEAPKNGTNLSTFDIARTGDGFWFQGRMVDSTDNIAASVNTGFVYFHRNGDNRMIEFDAGLFDYPGALYYDRTVSVDQTPILGFDGNEAFAAKEGLHIVKAGPNQGHDVWSNLTNFTAWSVQSGAHIEYTQHYILSNFDLIGKDPTAYSLPVTGISFGPNTSEIVVLDARIDGFKTGIDLGKHFTNSNLSPELHNYTVIDAIITDTAQAYANYNAALDTITTKSALPGLAPDLVLDGPLTYRGELLGWDDRAVQISGSKTDTLGRTDFPGGTDDFRIRQVEVARLLEENGYWTTSGGKAYFLTDIYFTDRVSGDIFYETHPVFLSDKTAANVASWLPSAKSNGTQDILTINGIKMAGDQVLDVALRAIPPESTTMQTEAMHDEDGFKRDGGLVLQGGDDSVRYSSFKSADI
jgi:hypothetical protein